MNLRFPRFCRRRLLRQRMFPVHERSQRLTGKFKTAILALTALGSFAIVAASPTGRFLVGSAYLRAREAARRGFGLPRDRAEIDAEWRHKRARDVENTRKNHLRVYEHTTPEVRKLMDYAGLDPSSGLLRWGNFDQVLLLPSKVFVPDDAGRSYRLRPNTRSVWVRNITLEPGVLAFFLVPDGAGLADAIKGSDGVVVADSVQTTNSWGCRGPEPDPNASLRGIAIGDSFMEGFFIGDSDTPPARLERYLASSLATRVSILNAGVLGYSPEQYYFTLRDYINKCRPHFVIVSVCPNDFGNAIDVMERGRGDFDEGRYWLEQIALLCQARDVLSVAVPVPMEIQIVGKRFTHNYPARLAEIAGVSTIRYCDPIEDFVDEHVRLIAQRIKLRQSTSDSPLFNGHLGDGHFSPIGSQIWANAVGRRLTELLQTWRDQKRIHFSSSVSPSGRPFSARRSAPRINDAPSTPRTLSSAIPGHDRLIRRSP